MGRHHIESYGLRMGCHSCSDVCEGRRANIFGNIVCIYILSLTKVNKLNPSSCHMSSSSSARRVNSQHPQGAVYDRGGVEGGARPTGGVALQRASAGHTGLDRSHGDLLSAYVAGCQVRTSSVLRAGLETSLSWESPVSQSTCCVPRGCDTPQLPMFSAVCPVLTEPAS